METFGDISMENKDTKSMEKLKIQADQVNLAMDSVPTEQIAKEVLKGKIKDALYIKLKISIENRLGIASILVSTYKKKILEVYSIAGNGNILTKTIPFEEPKSFIQKFIDFNDEGEVDTSLTETIGRSIYYAFPLRFWRVSSISGVRKNSPAPSICSR